MKREDEMRKSGAQHEEDFGMDCAISGKQALISDTKPHRHTVMVEQRDNLGLTDMQTLIKEKGKFLTGVCLFVCLFV